MDNQTSTKAPMPPISFKNIWNPKKTTKQAASLDKNQKAAPSKSSDEKNENEKKKEKTPQRSIPSSKNELSSGSKDKLLAWCNAVADSMNFAGL